MNLALFDFDGTISSRDSFLLFLWYTDKTKFLSSCLSLFPHIILYILKKYPGRELKEAFLAKAFLGRHIEELENLAEAYCRDVLPTIIRSDFRQRLQWHQNRNDTIYIVTASPRFILEPWCRNNQIEILGTELEIDRRGKVTGKLAGENCRSHEKVRRIQSVCNLSNYDEIFAYGDTNGDLPMLALADSDKQFYKPFR